MSQDQTQEGRFEFRISPPQRGDFLRKVRETLGDNPYVMAERTEGTDLIITIIPVGLSPGTAQQLSELAAQVDIQPVKSGTADAAVEF